METFRWAYIGCGSIAEKTAKDILKGNHQITSVYGRNYEKACAFAEKHGAKAFKTAEEAILCDNVDAVYIATPHTSHLEYSITSLKNHRPVLCEKPIGININDVDKIMQCAKENKTYFCEAMWTWFSDVALTVKEWVQSGKIGEIEEIKINYSFPGVLKPKSSRVLTPETAGGALLDIGIYPITYCYNLLGYPNEITCNGTIKNGIDISEKITLKYDTAVCKFNVSLTTAREDCVIKGTKGKISLPLFHMASKATLKNNNGKEIFNGKTDYLTEFTRAAEEIRAGKTQSDYIPLSTTRDCMKIMDECRKQMHLKYPFE